MQVHDRVGSMTLQGDRSNGLRPLLTPAAKPVASLASKRGHRLRARERHSAALFWFKLADWISPGQANVTGHIGASLMELGQYDAARPWLRASCDGVAARGRELLCTAHCLVRLGKADLAAETFSRACELSPDDAQVLSEAAGFFRTVNQREKARVLLETAIALRPDDAEIARMALAVSPRNRAHVDRLHFVTIGTTGLCNASCVHCPTGKAETSHVPRIPMAMPLFRRIIDGLRESRLPIVEGVTFGLFGDGLVDPHVVERAKYVRANLPDIPLVINTNGAAYDRKKHAELIGLVTTINLHCESLRPEVYDQLMVPLRMERTHTKLDMIMQDFAGRAQVTIPVSRANRHDMAALQTHFLERGAVSVVFTPLSSRCARDQSAFDRLAFDPKPIRCSTDLFDNLTIDCDGTVVACCNDFAREVPIGNASEQSLDSLLRDQRRLKMAEAFQQDRHTDYSTCVRCRADVTIPACT
ncbi:hypothetical protein DMC47_07645 [Nostoc sp. 3335mG]|nr:hypothetical protein DMC47_07645 [Nostoc sp. 3335mG]